MVLPMDEFRAAVKAATWLKLDGPLKVKTGKPAGRPKKGYAYVDDEASVASATGGVGGAGNSDEEYGASGGAGRHGRSSTGGASAVNKVKVKFRANSVDESVLSGASTGGAGGASGTGGTGRGRGRPKKVHAADEGECAIYC